MKGATILLAVVGALLLQGCSTYALEKPEQLYVAQPYLPLPADYHPDDKVKEQIASGASSTSACADVIATSRGLDERREFAPAPGMTLHFTETSYDRNRASAMPILSDWSWRIPLPVACGGGEATWTRRDLLVARHLLSSARIQKDTPTSNAAYWRELATWAGCQDSSCSLLEMQRRMLDPFVAGLTVAVRGVNQPGVEISNGVNVPATIEATPLGDRSLAAWYGDLITPRGADFFPDPTNLPGAGGQIWIATYCGSLPGPRKAVQSAVPTPAAAQADIPSAVRSPACNFSVKSLMLETPEPWKSVGGDHPPIPGSKLTLASSGDALFLFRPLAFKALLDSSGRWVCPPDSGGPDSPRRSVCSEEDRVSQGFLDFETVFTVAVTSIPEVIEVDPAMSVAAFERRYGKGAHIQSIRRRVEWLPKGFLLVDGKNTKTVPTSKFAQDGRVTFQVGGGTGGSLARGIRLSSQQEQDVLLAPGDIITFDHQARR